MIRSNTKCDFGCARAFGRFICGKLPPYTTRPQNVTFLSIYTQFDHFLKYVNLTYATVERGLGRCGILRYEAL
jgi:hypothetical protein